VADDCWTDPGTLELDMIFLETPHRLTLIRPLGDRTFRARWNVRPLARSNRSGVHPAVATASHPGHWHKHHDRAQSSAWAGLSHACHTPSGFLLAKPRRPARRAASKDG
jgi:hypothetical protein